MIFRPSRTSWRKPSGSAPGSPEGMMICSMPWPIVSSSACALKSPTPTKGWMSRKRSDCSLRQRCAAKCPPWIGRPCETRGGCTVAGKRGGRLGRRRHWGAGGLTSSMRGEADHASRIDGRGDSTPHARERLSPEAGRGRLHVDGPGGKVWQEGQKESQEWAGPLVPGGLDVDDLVQPFLVHPAFAR